MHQNIRVSDRVQILGCANRSLSGWDAYRVDFTVRVPAGVRPTKVEVNAWYYSPTSWVSLALVSDIQAVADLSHRYAIVHTQHEGTDDILYISARGDAVSEGLAKTYTPYIRVKLPTNESLAQKFTVENIVRGANGRPIALNPWDTKTAGIPGYAGPNSQAGWGNVVTPTGNAVPGGRFYLDAINSGRDITAGCDVTNTLIYQWVDQDGNRIGQASTCTIKNNSGTFSGSFISEPQSFDKPGYYRLMVWPQAESSSPTAPANCSEVSYDPSDLTQGTQVGSVFWKLPTSTRGAVVTNPRDIEVSDKIHMLGWLNRFCYPPSTDEFRADFTVRVPANVVPTKVEYNLYYYNLNAWYSLTRVPDVQSSVDQAYSIVHTQHDGAEDILYISARGDAGSEGISATKTYNPYIRVTLPNNEVLHQVFSVEDIARTALNGRPLALNPWDTTTAGIPGYAGPNSQAGWGNVVTPTGNAVPGGRFYLDAINSGRDITTGCDVTNTLIYQWVDQDGNRIGQPETRGVEDHASGFSGSFISEPQSFDKPGYYRLMVWPQAESSSPTAPANCFGVSYDPSDLTQGTQVGSVFWKLPTSVREAVDVSLTAPANGSSITTAIPTLGGRGEPGASIEVTDAAGTLMGTATVNASGAWSTVSTPLANGPVTATATQTTNYGNSTATVTFTVAHETIPFALSSPAHDALFIVGDTVRFSGTGHPGATIAVTDKDPDGISTATSVHSDGTWNVDVPQLFRGAYTGYVTLHAEGVSSDLPYSFSVVNPLVVIDPAAGLTVDSHQPTFTGTAEPGSLVLIFDKTESGDRGPIRAAANTSALGSWSAPALTDYLNGDQVVIVEQQILHAKVGDSVERDFVVSHKAVDVSLTAPANGSSITTAIPTLGGRGEPGASIEVTDAAGTLMGTATVNASGAWSTVSTPLANGPVTATATQTTNYGNSTATVTFTVVANTGNHHLTITSPTGGSTVTDRLIPFTGTATPFSTIRLFFGPTEDGHGDTDQYGNWTVWNKYGFDGDGEKTVIAQMHLDDSDTPSDETSVTFHYAAKPSGQSNEQWVPSRTYDKGDVVVHQGHRYRASQRISGNRDQTSVHAPSLWRKLD